MPTPLLKKLAHESGLSLKEVEAKWDEAKHTIPMNKYYWPEVVSLTKKLIGLKESMENTSYEELLGFLLYARNVAHIQHWKTTSFAEHMALNDLYELLSELTDSLAEMYMGVYELGNIPQASADFDTKTPVAFVTQMLADLAEFKAKLPDEGFIVNKYEELQGEISQVLYKLKNLK